MDVEQLERLIEQHAAALRLFAAQWTDTPEDCVQDALLSLVRQRTPPARVVPWLYRVVRNRAISLSRSAEVRQRHERTLARRAPPWFVPHRTQLVDDEMLTRALQSLSEAHREVIVARIWGGLSFEETAEVVGISSSSAHRRYHAALDALREKLGLTWLINTKNCPAS